MIFMDIQLSDGSSFEIFDRIEVPAPVIFTTAYDEYELKAFKVNALDYLIKPIDPEEVKTAIKKYSNMTEMACAGTIAGRYPQKLLVSNKDRLVPISTSEVAYIYMSDKNGHICLSDGTRFRNRRSLDEMSKLLRSCLKFFLRKFETGFFFEENSSAILRLKRRKHAGMMSQRTFEKILNSFSIRNASTEPTNSSS